MKDETATTTTPVLDNAERGGMDDAVFPVPKEDPQREDDTDDQAQRTNIVALWIAMNWCASSSHRTMVLLLIVKSCSALAVIFDPIVSPGLNVYISFLIWSL